MKVLLDTKGEKLTYVIAEIGVNHNGSLALAKDLVRAAKDAGADCAKFQTFRADALAKSNLQKAQYQQQTTDAAETQHQMLKRLELKREDHFILAEECKRLGIDFMSSPFDVEDAKFLMDNFEMPYVKIASGEISNGPLLFEAARRGKPVLLSTGMSTLFDIESALRILACGYLHPERTPDKSLQERAFVEGSKTLKEKVTVLHCVSQYPAPMSDLNLRAISTLSREFNIPVGYSDHSEGHLAAVAAIALGATVIEKHLTLDRNLAGPDHRASLDPIAFKSMVEAVRLTEAALGDGIKQPRKSEIENRDLVRRSLVLKSPIKKGEVLSEAHLTSKRPGVGISPLNYWNVLNRSASRDLEAEHVLEESDFL